MPDEGSAKTKIVEISQGEIDELHMLALKLIDRLRALELRVAMAKDKPPEPKPAFYEQPEDGVELDSD